MREAVARSVEVQRIPLLDLTREYRAQSEELLAACARVFARMQLLGGEELRAFETEMAAYLGVHVVRGVASGTDALLLALLAAGVLRGDEVLVQANAFVAAVEAIHRTGAVPVPVDVRVADLGPDPDALAAAITPCTRAILVVHLHGFPVELGPILALAATRRVAVVEDCSHAHGATLDGRRVGSFGAAGAFSLGVVKNLAAYGDAGIVSTNDAALAGCVRLLGTHGQVRKNDHAFYGTNSRLDELQAALLRVKLRVLDARNARRAEIAAFYDDRLRGLLTTPYVDPARTHVYHQYVVRTPAREALQRYLGAHGIETGVHYPVPIHRQPAWLAAYGESPALPRAEQAAREMLSLPVHADLADGEVEYVADTVAGFFPPMTAVNVGIVGLGYWGTNLVRTFCATPGARVTDLCDRDGATLARAGDALPGARRTTDMDALLARDDVDAIVIATPPSRHHAMALAALHAGKHAWVEKPLALTLADGRELVDVAAAGGRVLFVDETFLYDPLVREMKRLVEAGALGRVMHLSFERLGLGRIRRDSSVWWNSAPHDLSILLHLVPRRVVASRLHLHGYVQPGIADMAVCDLDLEGGVSAHLYLSWLHPEKIAKVTVVGEERMLSYQGRFENRAITLYDYALDLRAPAGDGAPIVPVSHFAGRPLEMPAGREPLALAAEHFLDSVRAGTEPLTSGRRSLQVVEVLEAAERGATRGDRAA